MQRNFQRFFAQHQDGNIAVAVKRHFHPVGFGVLLKIGNIANTNHVALAKGSHLVDGVYLVDMQGHVHFVYFVAGQIMLDLGKSAQKGRLELGTVRFVVKKTRHPVAISQVFGQYAVHPFPHGIGAHNHHFPEIIPLGTNMLQHFHEKDAKTDQQDKENRTEINHPQTGNLGIFQHINKQGNKGHQDQQQSNGSVKNRFDALGPHNSIGIPVQQQANPKNVRQQRNRFVSPQINQGNLTPIPQPKRKRDGKVQQHQIPNQKTQLEITGKTIGGK